MASSMNYQCQGCGAFTEVQQVLPEFMDHYTCAAVSRTTATREDY